MYLILGYFKVVSTVRHTSIPTSLETWRVLTTNGLVQSYQKKIPFSHKHSNPPVECKHASVCSVHPSMNSDFAAEAPKLL